MRKALSVLLMLAFFILPCMAETAAMGDIILVTEYRQMGWGDRVQVGCVDSNGNLWYMEGHDSDLNWPYDTAAQTEYLENCGSLEYRGALTRDITSLLIGLPDNYEGAQMGACDAGTETSYAVMKDGTAVILGMSGDDVYENTDAAAQSLYALLRKAFPDVVSYAYEGNMGPAGFEKMTVTDYLGADETMVAAAQITAYDMDCETGAHERELTEDEAASVRSLALSGIVVGKANNLFVTGGTTVYIFTAETGETVLRMEVMDGMLVTDDGMYGIDR